MSNHIENSAMMPIPEHWLKRSWRFILQAYYRHLEIEDPEKVAVKPGYFRKDNDPRVYHAPGKGLVPVTPPTYAKDALVTEVVIKLGFFDILRCLLGCHLRVHSVTYCETPPGAVKTNTITFATFD